MVKTDIWMPVFIGDYLADTMHLSTEQHGAYLLLLFHLWRRGSLRDDDAVMAKISGLGESAWSLHRPVLAEFFKIQDGVWQHGRVEKEKARVAATKQSQAKKAKLAACSRWKKSDASGIAQAMPGDADSDSDSDSKQTFPGKSIHTEVSPLRCAPVEMTKGGAALPEGFAPVGMTALFEAEEEQQVSPLRCDPVGMTKGGQSLPEGCALVGMTKGRVALPGREVAEQMGALFEIEPDRSGRETAASELERLSFREKGSRVSDSRHVPFRAILAMYWRAKNHASPEMPWQGRDAKALSTFLAACPRLNEAQFRQMVGNRARSAVAHGDRVYLWIANLTRFQEEITVYNKPASAGGSYASRAEINRNSVVSAVDGALMLAQKHTDRVRQAGAQPAGFDDPGVSAADGPRPGRCAVALPGNGDHGLAAGHPAYGQTGTDGPLSHRTSTSTAGQADRDGRQEVSLW